MRSSSNTGNNKNPLCPKVYSLGLIAATAAVTRLCFSQIENWNCLRG